MKYGLTEETIAQMRRVQDDRCWICDAPLRHESNFVVDHCHRTDKVRGLLCPQCNFGLGNFRDSVPNLIRAILYLDAGNELATFPDEQRLLQLRQVASRSKPAPISNEEHAQLTEDLRNIIVENERLARLKTERMRFVDERKFVDEARQCLAKETLTAQVQLDEEREKLEDARTHERNSALLANRASQARDDRQSLAECRSAEFPADTPPQRSDRSSARPAYDPERTDRG